MRKLEKDNIREVVIGIKFSEVMLPLALIDEIVSSRFIDWTQKQTYTVNITDKALSAPLVSKERHGVSLEKSALVVFLERDRIALVKQAPYYDDGGNKLIHDFREIISYFKELDFTKAIDFGLRYVNLLKISSERLKENDFNFFNPPNLSCELNAANEEYRRIQLFNNKDSVAQTINVNVKRLPESLIEIVLDIDVHFRNAISDSSLESCFNILREQKNSTFLKVFPNVYQMKEFKNE